YSVFLPNLDLQATLWQMDLVATASIALNVTNVPTNAAKVAAVIDGAGLATPVSANQAGDGSGSASILLNIPAGGPYRIRVLSSANASGGNVLRSGVAEGINVAVGA